MNKAKWDGFYSNKLQPESRKLVHELNTLCRYVNKNAPLSRESVEALATKISDIRIAMDTVRVRLAQIERMDL